MTGGKDRISHAPNRKTPEKGVVVWERQRGWDGSPPQPRGNNSALLDSANSPHPPTSAAQTVRGFTGIFLRYSVICGEKVKKTNREEENRMRNSVSPPHRTVWTYSHTALPSLNLNGKSWNPRFVELTGGGSWAIFANVRHSTTKKMVRELAS